MPKFLAILATIIIMITHWLPSAVLTLVILAMLDSGSFLLRVLVAIAFFNVWHWGGYFLGLMLMSASTSSQGDETGF